MSDERMFSGDEIKASAQLPDWEPMHESLQARFASGDFSTGLAFVNAIGQAAEAANHHPDIDLRYTHVNILLTSHDVGGKTQRDLDLARQISDIAAEMGISADPDVVSRVELALDTWDIEEVRPFWAAVLGMEAGKVPDEITDPAGDLPTIWFQEADRTQTPSQRWHLDIRVPPQVASERIEAGVAAGGTVVSTEHAPAFTVLADPQGNKVCVCTHVGRSH
jgi:4a-hydroxytetrahydrobiopterin dehydratase